jgi:carbamate kinase
MASVLGIEEMMILTAVSKVAVNFARPDQRWLDRVPLAEMKQLHAAGHFAAGSMGPKVEAAIDFLERGGRRCIIAHLDEALPALCGETGTHVTRDGD